LVPLGAERNSGRDPDTLAENLRMRCRLDHHLAGLVLANQDAFAARRLSPAGSGAELS
jgi:hypothetical protein